MIERCTAATVGSLVELRCEMWPDTTASDHANEATAALASPKNAAFLARVAGEAVGFAEVSIRHDYVNGCETSPVAFLEGIYVRELDRRKGIATALHAAVRSWAVAAGMTELGSDALLANTTSHAMHAALGFVATERVIYFRQPL